MFLVTRSELLRHMDIGPGKRLAIIAAPLQFIQWMDIGISPAAVVSGSIPDEGGFDTVIYWDRVGEEDTGLVTELGELIAEGGSVWAVASDEERFRQDIQEKDVITLDEHRNLYRLV